MKIRSLARLLLALFLAFGIAAPSLAATEPERDRSVSATRWVGEEDDEDDGGWSDEDDGGWSDDDGGGDSDDDRGSSGGGHGAPEIDPGLLVAGVVLLAGGTAILVGRRRQRRAPELS